MDNLNSQIADIEREIANAKACRDQISMRDPQRNRVNKALAKLQARHEHLVMQVQRATVGAVKAGQVL